jgi:Mitochondrial small ribosomal subunit Rsm22/Histidine kinase-, DNA gyrase B-, and HSP90-like ATPase
LRAAVDRALSGRRTADLAAAAAVLSERYRNERRDGRLHVESDDDALAYLAVRLPATYAALRASFAAIAEARPDFAPKTALDVGAGPGTALWAVADCWPALADALLAVLAALDVNSLIREVLSKMRGDLENHRIMIDTTLSDGLAPVYANAVSMRQVMVNLIANAADAMGAVVNRQRLSRLGTQASEPPGLLITVEDSDSGVDPAHAARIFEPFFTTKSHGMGHGAVDLPLVRRTPRRTAFGHSGPQARIDFSGHAADPRTQPFGGRNRPASSRATA